MGRRPRALSYFEVPELWSRGFAAIAGVAVELVIVVATLATVFTIPLGVDFRAVGGWGSVLSALGLAGIYLTVEFWHRERDRFFIGAAWRSGCS